MSVFNVCEVGFDSPTKLVSGGPRFMVDPTLRHCTSAMGWIRFLDRQALHYPNGSLAVRLKHKKKNLGEIPHLPAPETDQGIDGEVSLGLPSAINMRFFPLSKRGTKINESLLSSLFTRNLNLSVFSVFPCHFVSAYYRSQLSNFQVESRLETNAATELRSFPPRQTDD